MGILLSVFLPLALAFIMFSLGLGLTLADFGRVLRMPKAFLAGATAQVIALPIIAFVLLMVFRLPPELAVGVMILALSPGGVTSNMLTKFAGGSVALSVTLTAVVSLLAVLTVPFLTAWSVDHFMGETAPQIDVTAIAVAMFLITAVPVILGLGVRAAAPGFADRIERAVSIAAAVLFVVIILGALAANWGAFVDNIGTLGPLLVTLNLILLALGFGVARALRLPRPEAVAISLEAGIQNGTLGITVASLLVEAASGLNAFSLPSGVYGITMYLVTLPFVFLFRTQAATRPH